MQNSASPSYQGPPVHESTTLMRELTKLSDEFELYLGAELTVNPTDLQAMTHLIQRGPMSPTEIARVLGISTAAATAVIDRLAKVGHVTRTPHPTDRRGVIVAPEPTSVARAMRALMPMISGIDRVIYEFDESEQAVITDYLRRVVAVYRDSMPPAGEE